MSHAPGTPADLSAMANALRFLALDAVKKANSGHSGMPMGMADVAAVLFSEFLKFDAAAPRWPDRDRFVLSAGHGSMLLYGLGYLLGYDDLPIEELKAFRQLDSRTAGHPEFGHAGIVETTTGPLGQGFANAVGMAIAEAHLRARFGGDLCDHHTYVIAGDGCLMEGLSQEALTLAGHLRLGRLIVLWDDNNISIDGPVSLADSTDQLQRFEASGWAVDRCDGHDHETIRAALTKAQDSDRPVLIACKTLIGRGAPTQAGTAKAHGAIVDDDEIAGARKAMDWPYAPFEVPESILSAWRAAGGRGAAVRKNWEERVARSAKGGEYRTALEGDYASAIRLAIASHTEKLAAEPVEAATRKASGMAIEALAPVVPELLGGSADLTGSNNTLIKAMKPFTGEDPAGSYLHYGVREHAMAAAVNGMALHGGVVPYAGTFMVFSDYARPAIRLAALMGIRSIFVMTHDSIGVGEDGPTHQPVEHVSALRAVPGLNVFRPADTIETAECWEIALNSKDTPSVLALTRQNLPQMRRDGGENCSLKGAYILAEAEGAAVTLLATGSEVSVAMAARDLLAKSGVEARVVSMPCWELFDAQPAAYRAKVLGETPARIAIEAGVRHGWDRYLRPGDDFIGMESFGKSAPAGVLFEHFGITAKAVSETAQKLLGDAPSRPQVSI